MCNPTKKAMWKQHRVTGGPHRGGNLGKSEIAPVTLVDGVWGHVEEKSTMNWNENWVQTDAQRPL